MDDVFRRSLAISAAFHAVVVLATSVHVIFKPKYIVVPVDLIYYSPPAPSSVEEPPKEEEVAIPRKLVPPKKQPKPRRQEKKEKTAPVSPTPAPPAPLESSASISPETAKFPYLYYLKKVRDKISSNWGWGGKETGGFKTVVYFRIRRDGSIEEPRFKEKSGDETFDAVAVRAVKISSPFPPLPSGYDEDVLGIYFEFSYKE